MAGLHARGATREPYLAAGVAGIFPDLSGQYRRAVAREIHAPRRRDRHTSRIGRIAARDLHAIPDRGRHGRCGRRPARPGAHRCGRVGRGPAVPSRNRAFGARRLVAGGVDAGGGDCRHRDRSVLSQLARGARAAGMAPENQLKRGSQMQIQPILAALRHHKAGTLLIALQIALTLAIVCNALFIIQQRLSHLSEPTGIEEANLFVIDNQWADQMSPQQTDAQIQSDLAALRQLPGVRDAVSSNSYPLRGGGWDDFITMTPDQVQKTTDATVYF